MTLHLSFVKCLTWKFFNREIYHCPFCNLCRVGKGLGIDYFHCMNCNACMSRSLSLHVCREKSFEDNCPICHEDIFTSAAPVKALPCGHIMHSICFQVLDLLFSPITFTHIQPNLSPSHAVDRTILVHTTPAQSVASHLGTCRSVMKLFLLISNVN